MQVLRTAFVLAALLIGMGAVAQRSLTAEGLPSLSSVVGGEGVVSIDWILAYWDDDPNTPRQEPVRMSNRVLNETFSLAGKERQFLEAFRGPVALALRDLTFIGGQRVSVPTGDRSPARFFVHRDQLGVMLSGLGLEFNFNSLNMDQGERFYRVLYEMLLPEAGVLHKHFADYGFHYVGMAVTYGFYSFPDDPAIGDAETLIAIFPVDVLGRYENLEATDGELIRSSLVFGGEATSIRNLEMY